MDRCMIESVTNRKYFHLPVWYATMSFLTPESENILQWFLMLMSPEVCVWAKQHDAKSEVTYIFPMQMKLIIYFDEIDTLDLQKPWKFTVCCNLLQDRHKEFAPCSFTDLNFLSSVFLSFHFCLCIKQSSAR